MKTHPVVTAVTLFAVRSCAGEDLQQAEVTPNGFIFDRQWRLVTPQGKFLTQRECPKMALIHPRVHDGKLRLSCATMAQDAPECQDDLNLAAIAISDSHTGIDQGDAVAEWLFTVLDVEARLLRVVTSGHDSDFSRPDMSPVLVISEESLADLNSRLQVPVPMNRFRPNIVVRGVEPYEEESWTRVRIGDVWYVASAEPCGRCSMINIDQVTGKKAGKEPLKTLAGYRRTPGAVIFGKYMVPESSGVVRVNDSVTLS